MNTLKKRVVAAPASKTKSRKKRPNVTKRGRCLGYGYPVYKTEQWCGECVCEGDGE